MAQQTLVGQSLIIIKVSR